MTTSNHSTCKARHCRHLLHCHACYRPCDRTRRLVRMSAESTSATTSIRTSFRRSSKSCHQERSVRDTNTRLEEHMLRPGEQPAKTQRISHNNAAEARRWADEGQAQAGGGWGTRRPGLR
eukprot:1449883-Rhodomonas_salina.1